MGESSAEKSFAETGINLADQQAQAARDEQARVEGKFAPDELLLERFRSTPEELFLREGGTLGNLLFQQLTSGDPLDTFSNELDVALQKAKQVGARRGVFAGEIGQELSDRASVDAAIASGKERLLQQQALLGSIFGLGEGARSDFSTARNRELNATLGQGAFTSAALRDAAAAKQGIFGARFGRAAKRSDRPFDILEGFARGAGQGAGSVVAASSIVLKENIKVIDNALNVINKIKGVEFNWKENNESDGGVIAEQIEKVIPNVVIEIDGIKHIKPMMIIGYLIESIKELTIELNKIKGE